MKLYHGSNVPVNVPEELRYPQGITFQYFFGTERALKYLKRI